MAASATAPQDRRSIRASAVRAAFLRVGLVAACALAGLPLMASAQDLPNDSPGANDFPDASVGQGGADKTSQESEDSVTTCVYAGDCEHGFSCVRGKCEYVRTRDARFLGCGRAAPDGGVAWAGLAGLALGLVRIPRRRPGGSPHRR